MLAEQREIIKIALGSYSPDITREQHIEIVFKCFYDKFANKEEFERYLYKFNRMQVNRRNRALHEG